MDTACRRYAIPLKLSTRRTLSQNGEISNCRTSSSANRQYLHQDAPLEAPDRRQRSPPSRLLSGAGKVRCRGLGRRQGQTEGPIRDLQASLLARLHASLPIPSRQIADSNVCCVSSNKTKRQWKSKKKRADEQGGARKVQGGYRGGDLSGSRHNGYVIKCLRGCGGLLRRLMLFARAVDAADEAVRRSGSPAMVRPLRTRVR